MHCVRQHLPRHSSCVTGYADKELLLDCTDRTFLLQPENSPAIIERTLAYRIAADQSLDTRRCEHLPGMQFLRHHRRTEP
jgi:hypothetical protein